MQPKHWNALKEIKAALVNAELTQEKADALLNAYTAISKIIANTDAEEQNGGSTVVPGKPGLPETDGQTPSINGGDPLANTGKQWTEWSTVGILLCSWSTSSGQKKRRNGRF